MFLLGHWKNYEELEESLSLPELFATLEAYREKDSADRKFMAAIQGIDLDKETGASMTGDDVIKNARAKAAGIDPNDILSLSGKNAEEAGFGIGMGLGYEVE